MQSEYTCLIYPGMQRDLFLRVPKTSLVTTFLQIFHTHTNDLYIGGATCLKKPAVILVGVFLGSVLASSHQASTITVPIAC